VIAFASMLVAEETGTGDDPCGAGRSVYRWELYLAKAGHRVALHDGPLSGRSAFLRRLAGFQFRSGRKVEGEEGAFCEC